MKNNPITTVRIDRTKWLRGLKDSEAGSFLWDVPTDRGCCLGHTIKQVCNIPERQLDGRYTPQDVLTGFTFLTDLAHFTPNRTINNIFAEEAMEINDKSTYSDKYRERRLVALFRRNGIKLEFFN